MFDQREAVRNAAPYSASTLAYATDFIYSLGTLCYMSGDEIRILDTHHRSREEQVISGQILASRFRTGPSLMNLPDDLLGHTTLLAHADNILVLLCEETTGPASWLIALDVRDSDTIKRTIGPCSRVRLRRRLASKTKLFVRHNKDYLYYGTHTALREDGHHEWLIQGFNLRTGGLVSTKHLRLAEFVGFDIGSTACFEINDGYFYAVSNQTSFDTEEVDWTSCYHYIRFRLDDTAPNLTLRKIWRRQHHEGPINDAWTELFLHSDEQTNQLNIVEVRKEWLGGGSLCTRTSYSTAFTEPQDEALILERPNFPSNNQLSRTLDEHSKPSWVEKPPIRIPKSCHHEHTSTSHFQNEFIRARTKHHRYNSSAHAFVDLVTEDIRIPNSVRSKDLLRLRSGSRIPASPLISNDSSSDPVDLILRPQIEGHDGEFIEDSEEAFKDTTISLWPPTHAPTELFDLLCPGGRAGAVHAVSDERSIVYMAGSPSPRHGGQRALVMISFDPGWGHDGLRRLHGGRIKARNLDGIQIVEGCENYYRPRAKDVATMPTTTMPPGNTKIPGQHDANERVLPVRRGSKREFDLDGCAESSSAGSKRNKGEDGSEPSVPQRTLWTEGAMYLDINRGFWFER